MFSEQTVTEEMNKKKSEEELMLHVLQENPEALRPCNFFFPFSI